MTNFGPHHAKAPATKATQVKPRVESMKLLLEKKGKSQIRFCEQNKSVNIAAMRDRNGRTNLVSTKEMFFEKLVSHMSDFDVNEIRG
jgi:hypothetical protein